MLGRIRWAKEYRHPPNCFHNALLPSASAPKQAKEAIRRGWSVLDGVAASQQLTAPPVETVSGSRSGISGRMRGEVCWNLIWRGLRWAERSGAGSSVETITITMTRMTAIGPSSCIPTDIKADDGLAWGPASGPPMPAALHQVQQLVDALADLGLRQVARAPDKGERGRRPSHGRALRLSSLHLSYRRMLAPS